MFNDRCPFDPINVHHFHVVRWVKRRKWIPARPPARPCHYFLFSSSSSSFFYLITCNKYIACLPSCFCIYECVTEYLLNYQILFFFGLSLFPRTGEEEKETKNQIIIFLLRPGSSYATSAFYWSVSEEEIQGSWRLAMRNNNSQISGRSNKKKKTFTFFFFIIVVAAVVVVVVSIAQTNETVRILLCVAQKAASFRPSRSHPSL